MVLFAFNHGRTGDLFIQKSPACTIGTLAEAVKKIFNPTTEVHEIGIRHGEKMFEMFGTLMTSEERSDNEILQAEPYTSSNTEQLDVNGTVEKLLEVDYGQDCLKGGEPT